MPVRALFSPFSMVEKGKKVLLSAPDFLFPQPTMSKESMMGNSSIEQGRNDLFQESDCILEENREKGVGVL